LVPSGNKDKDGINLVVSKWAARDPFNGYQSSLYSFQVNDFPLVGQNGKYLDNLLSVYSNKDFNEFTQINIGMENDYFLPLYKQGIKDIYQLLKDRQDKHTLRFISHSDFSDWFINRYPISSPAFVYFISDPAQKSQEKALWYQSPYYRIFLKSKEGKTEVMDFRVFNSQEAESFYSVKNISRTLYLETPAIIDSIKYKDSQMPIDFDLASATQDKEYWDFILTAKDQVLRLEPQKIIFTNITPPTLNHDEIKVKNGKDKIIWQVRPTIPFVNNYDSIIPFVLVSLVILVWFLVFCYKKLKRPNGLIFFGLLLSVSLSLSTVYRSGLVFSFGMGFWGPNGHDAIFHLSLIKSLQNSLLSLAHPQLANFNLQNYHLGFDYFSALFAGMFKLSPLNLYFRYFPLMSILLLGFLINRLLVKWQFSSLDRFLAILFCFLTGSFGFIVSLVSKHQFFGGESIFWANQSVSLLLNPPFVLSLIVLLFILYLLETNRHLWLLIILGALLIQIKIYAFIIWILALLVAKKFKIVLISCALASLFIIPSLNFSESSFPFIFSPGWFLKSMVSAHDRLNWVKLAQAWQAYEALGSHLKLFIVTTLAFAIFIVGNLGIRVLGLYYIFVKKGQLLSTKIVSSIIFLGLLLPILIIQRANPWNTIQFMYYSLFFLGFFTARQIGLFTQKIKSKLVLFIFYLLLAGLTLPTTFSTLQDYATKLSASRISFDEIHALDTLSRQKTGIVLSPLFDSSLSRNLPDPKPLYGYASTAYISAFSGQKEFLSDTINLEITGLNYKERAKNVQRFFQTSDAVWAKSFLLENNISYVYMTPLVKLNFGTKQSCLDNIIFDSGEITIYKVSCK